MNSRLKFLDSAVCLRQQQMNGPRVSKACDRCRLKKTKCDGRKPCSRCEAEDAVCSFAASKKFRNVMYPKGFVEMLLQQQEWLVLGLQELYKRTQLSSDTSKGSSVEGQSRVPSVHHILEQLGVLDKESCIAPGPGIVEEAKKYVYNRPNNKHPKAPHPLSINHDENGFELYEELKKQLSYEHSTVEATGDIYMSTSDVPFPALSGFQHAAQRAEPTLVDEPFAQGPSSYGGLTPGFGGLDGGIMETEGQIPFENSLPTVGCDDNNSTYTSDIFDHHRHPRSPVMHTRPTFGHNSSTSPIFGNVSFPASYRQWGCYS